MSNQSTDPPRRRRKKTSVSAIGRLGVSLILFLGLCLSSPIVRGETTAPFSERPLPLLVRARQGDTPATLAQRYLNDASMGWMIIEYNGLTSFSDGQAILVPQTPFRLGGLSPKGFQNVPVLAYPDVGESPGNDATLSRSAFENQMGWLKNSGFEAITPAQLIDFMDFSGQLPQHAVLITADTESLGFHETAVPILKTFGFTATLFVATDHIGKKGAMTWEQLKRLQKAGFTIGCRGHSGQSLLRTGDGQSLDLYFKTIAADLAAAKTTIDDRLHPPRIFLAYPFGGSNDLVAATAAKLGFSAAFIRSAGDNPYFGGRFGIHRIVVDSQMDPEQFTGRLTTQITADLD